MFGELGKLLIVLGLTIAVVGFLLVFLPSLRLGRLPGDLTIQFKHGRLFIPLGTCILLSVVLTLILWLIHWLRR